MIRRIAFAVCVFVILLFVAAVGVEAVPPLPSSFWGAVSVDGAPVPTTTAVVAWVGGTSYPATRAMSGTLPVYAVNVGGSDTWDPGAGGPPEDGATIVFKIGDKTADQKPAWHSGENHSNYALTASSTYPSPPQPIPASGPVDFPTQGVTLDFSSGCDGTATVTLHNGMMPDPPAGIAILSGYWEIETDCSPFVVTIIIHYDESDLNGGDELDIVVARYDSEDGWVYMTGVVDPDSNTVTISGVIELSTWALSSSAPPKAIDDLGASKSGADPDDLLLDWTCVSKDLNGNDITVDYNVYRSTDPYFTPGPGNLLTDPPLSDCNYTDSGVIGDTANNYYYVVTAVSDDTGAESAVSDRVGKFAKTIKQGMQIVSTPLILSLSQLKDVFAGQLTGAMNEANADRIWMWDKSQTPEWFRYAWKFDSGGTYPDYDGLWYETALGGETTLAISADQGFFIQSKQATDQFIHFIGTVSDLANRTINIEPGLQLIGTTYPVEVTLEDAGFFEDGAHGALNEANADRIWMWDKSKNPEWYRYAWLFDSGGAYPGYDGTWYETELGGETTMTLKPGFGYWYQNKGAVFTWTYPNPK